MGVVFRGYFPPGGSAPEGKRMILREWWGNYKAISFLHLRGQRTIGGLSKPYQEVALNGPAPTSPWSDLDKVTLGPASQFSFSPSPSTPHLG